MTLAQSTEPRAAAGGLRLSTLRCPVAGTVIKAPDRPRSELTEQLHTAVVIDALQTHREAPESADVAQHLVH